MNIVYYFAPGFGFNAQYWKHLKPYFGLGNCFDLDDLHALQQDTPVRRIGIGHSLGFLKLITSSIKFDGLIGLQAFNAFLGWDHSLHQKRTKIYRAFKHNFYKNTQETMRSFYKSSGINDNGVYHTNLMHLSDEMDVLGHGFEMASNIPTLILGSLRDEIVPEALIYDNFQDMPKTSIKFDNSCYHGMGYLNANWVFQQIQQFINDWVVT